METRAILLHIALLILFPFLGRGQNCATLSKANTMVPDKFCSPVHVNWDITYVGVTNEGTLVEILYDWDDGSTETVIATETVAGTFTANAEHNYISQDDRCNHHPLATLVVNGVVCTSSEQEQIVTIWDTDNENGGEVEAEPNVYPVCIGDGATMRFDDGTLFNCVPPQENDVPNEDTRWIQWVYGTRNTMSSLTPVSVEGYTGPWEWEGPVITLTGPVHGSNEQSLFITVAADNQIGDEFEVELRYWNYCNKYTDDADPVIDRSVIRIVDLPDATITPAGPLCEFNPSITLVAATGGGTWSGNGIVDAASGEFDPYVAGAGTHRIKYEITNSDGCSAADSIEIVVRDAPDAAITPVDPFCLNDVPYDLEAIPPAGTWSGNGITNVNTGTFNPAVAGVGAHDIVFTTAVDAFGCFGVDSAVITVVNLPFAEILTPDSAWCQLANNQSLAEIAITGSDASTFDLVFEIGGTLDTIFNLPSGTFTLSLNSQPGRNEYVLRKVIEHHGANSCETDLNDRLIMDVYPLPDMTLTISNDGWCSPVDVEFTATGGYFRYYWDFGDGQIELTNSSIRQHTYTIPEPIMETERSFTYRLGIETSHGCSDTTTGSLTIYPQPEADFFVNPEVQDYPASTVTLVNLSSSGEWSYLWEFGDGDSDTVEEPGQHEYGTYGAFDISLATYSEHCSDNAVKTVTIMPPSPVASFEHSPTGCPPLEVNFFNHSEYADSYIWDFDDGTFSTEPNPSHVFYQSKEYHVKLIAIGLAGSDTTEQIVYIAANPKALFTAYPTEATTLKQLFKFINNSIDAVSYLWDFGDGNTSTDENPSHTYEKGGVYTITLVAWSEDDCVDTLVQESLIRVVAGEGETNFPNAFVWNGSGPTGGYWEEGTIDNTVFHPHMENVIEMRMIIYNRWGEKLYESNEVHIGWDGYLNSEQLAIEGVYVYKCWVTYYSGQQEILTGDVTFLH
ncbi:MAG: PKD domain-containing protein [Bacteroidales bacterium]|nr:PKD domain-containing protein [Bacteroidales bacterium]